MIPTILQVIPSFEAGGVERVTFETVIGLTNLNFAKHNIASSGGHYVEQLPPNIQHYQLPLTTKNPLKLITNAHQLYKLIKNQNITIAHARSRAPAWSTLWACRKAKIPFITTYHGTYNSSGSLKNYYNSIMARGDQVIAISRFIYEHIQKKHPELMKKVSLIPEGIDVNYFDPAQITQERINTAREAFQIPVGAKVFLLSGRLTRWKGQAWFLEALKQICPIISEQNIHIVLLGDAQGRNDYVKDLQQLASGLPIHFVISYADLPAAYALSDIVFSCSLDPEAFGRVTAEALAMGRPFIGTNHGGTIELTNNGLFGKLVTPHQNTSLVAAITEILKTPTQHLIKRGEDARNYICQNYSLNQMLHLTKQLYEFTL
jgi:glycosyltransferase involved in cell wall biosynthesis